MNKYRIKINGKIYEMEVEIVDKEENNKTNFSSNELKKEEIEEIKKTHTSTSSGVSANIIESPMPGCVIDICVRVGDVVKANQVVMIIESMKMENEVCAPKDGKIKTIFVSEGQNISINTKLFEMEY